MSEQTCECYPDLPNHLRAPNCKPTNFEEPCNVSTLCFESVEIGTTSRQTFKIRNDDKVAHTYKVKRTTQTNSMFKVFDVKITKNVVDSGKELEVVVSYTPKFPQTSSIEYVNVTDEEMNLCVLRLRGKSTGATVTASINTLLFYRTRSRKELTKTFELHNSSETQTYFRFELNNDQQNETMFRVNRRCGVLEAKLHRFLTVTFVCTKNGIFSQQLVCQIPHHHPVIVELVGINTDLPVNALPQAILRPFPLKLEEKDGFRGYMYDIARKLHNRPPFSLSSMCIDFEKTIRFDGFESGDIQTTCLTNHLPNPIRVTWQIPDNYSIFSIRPTDIIIPGNQSVLYECAYRPNSQDALDVIHLRGLVFWSDYTLKQELCQQEGQVEKIDLPLPVTLRFCGHTFAENRAWVPCVELETEQVVLPPALPDFSTFTTLTLRSLTPLPTLFKFIPPEKSHFLMKPTFGILKDCEIVTIQLEPGFDNCREYVEKWMLELNGCRNECCSVILRGCSELPVVRVGVNDLVAFEAVFPGCQDVSKVLVENVSIHGVVYEFLACQDLSIDRPLGELASNEYTVLTWTYTGNRKSPEVSNVTYQLRTVHNDKIQFGLPITSNVMVYTKCAYSELIVTPKKHDFGRVRWGENLCTFFHLFNFGQSKIYFTLIADNSKVSLEPKCDCVPPKKSVKVNVTFRATKTEREEIRIGYQIRVSSSSPRVLDEKVHPLYKVAYTGVFPVVQIDAIVTHDFGPLFSKLTLWELFRIDALNEVLRNVRQNSTLTVNFYLPDFEQNDSTRSAVLVLRNTTEFDTEVEIVREKSCDCKPIVRSKGISLRQIVYDCCHRRMMKFQLDGDKVVEANKCRNVILEAKYLEEGFTTVNFLFKLSNRRAVRVETCMRVLPLRAFTLSAYVRTLEFDMKDVYIGEKCPAAQVFTLYNNSNYEVEYFLNANSLNCLNCDYGFEILRCLNPSGSVMSITAENLIFEFTPIESKVYEVNVPLMLGEENCMLRVRGKGIEIVTSDVDFHSDTIIMPCSSESSQDNLVELSLDHLAVEHFPVWSKVEKLVFIKNQTSDKIIGYCWQPYYIQDVVKVEVVYKKGVLQPKECRALTFRIRSFNKPCRLRLNVVCKLLDHSAYLIHKKSILAYERKQKENENLFIITENGISYPENDVKIEPKPEPFFNVISTSVYITSTADRDLHASIPQQLSFPPKSTITVCVPPILQRHHKKSAESTTDQKLFDEDQADFFATTLESLIGDVVFGSSFRDVIKTTSDASSHYYAQFISEKIGEDAKSDKSKNLIRKIRLADKFLNRSSGMPEMAQAMEEMLVDSVHAVFKLGAPKKSSEGVRIVYKSAISKMMGERCACNSNQHV